MEENEAESEEIGGLAEIIAESKAEFNKKYGWVKLAKDVATYTNTSFFEILKSPCCSIFSIATMMLEESELNQIQSNKTEN